MKIKQIRIAVGRTVNLGNYESLRIDVDFTADIDDNENPQMAFENLRAAAKLELKRCIQIETQKQKEKELW